MGLTAKSTWFGKGVAAQPASMAAPQAKTRVRSGNDTREVIESIAFAFILAFILRTFLAEAFVIPTGSMAPTLYGRCKEVTCSQCRHQFAIGASDELNRSNGTLEMRIETATCPNCRFENDVKDRPVFSGDRILVNKWTYELAKPSRWDVVVFKFPEEPETNYIKRLVGLPGEMLRIWRGDIYVRPGLDGEYKIARKDDPNKQRVIQQSVYDDTEAPRVLIDAGWPERWQGVEIPANDVSPADWKEDPAGWKADRKARSFSITGNDSQSGKWLRYRHYLPTPEAWNQALDNQPMIFPAKPQLIADFCSYNHYAPMGNGQRGEPDPYWVGDIAVTGKFRLGPPKDGNENANVIIELTRGVRVYQCVIGTDGYVTLRMSDELAGEEVFRPIARSKSPVVATGSWFNLEFANFDQRLCVWINDQLVEFDAETTYAPPALYGPQLRDLSPVGIFAQGREVDVEELRIFRDIYYRADRDLSDGLAYPVTAVSLTEYSSPGRLAALLSDPLAWGAEYEAHAFAAEFPALGADEYFMMGDNSPRSQDARQWSNTRGADRRHAVPGSALVGKAFSIFWPHGVPFMNDGKGYAPLPFFYHKVNKAENPDVENYPRFSIPFYPQWWRWTRIR